jgi:hypothetical protein
METSKLYPVLLTLLDICKERKGRMDKSHYTGIALAKEFCTIELKACRGAGHTLAIINLVQSRFDKSIIMVPSENQKHTLISSLEYYGVPEDRYSISCVGSGKCRQVMMRGVDYSMIDAVLWDCAYTLTNKDKDNMYAAILPSCGRSIPYFIFLE